ncbi:hypothetical protein R1sor_023594 [Riccia sorocarpa]|uniref:Lipid desaturase domain-containing protein n=1 Tax=Riccia sorocarpa TaxID=122646 RepID=A0ABD3GN80_9MARC
MPHSVLETGSSSVPPFIPVHRGELQVLVPSGGPTQAANMTTVAATSCGLCAGTLVVSLSFDPLYGSSKFSQGRTRQCTLFTSKSIRSPSSRASSRRHSIMAVLLQPPPKRQELNQQSQESEAAGPGPSSISKSSPQLSDLGRKISSLPAELGLNDTNLESTTEHRLWVGAGVAGALGLLTKAVTAATSPRDVVLVATSIIAGYALADLGSGVYHWGVDNYGDARTPIFGSQIDAFQGHHKRPWTITTRQFANNTYAIVRPVSLVLAPFLALPSNPAFESFLGTFLGMILMSQQIHAWSHMRKSQLPKAVVALQDKGVLLSRKMHGAHHRSPYNVNYCIVSGLWNPFLDQNRVFPRLESFIQSKFGIAPRSWFETQAEWLQEGGYFEDGTDVSSEL